MRLRILFIPAPAILSGACLAAGLIKVQIEESDDMHVILGHAGFIKVAKGLYDTLISSSSGIKFGLAFAEASGLRLIRREGKSGALKTLADRNIMSIGACHSSIILFNETYLINAISELRRVLEVFGTYCATINPAQVLLETEQGRSILGIVDVMSPSGVETKKDVEKRHRFPRGSGYKK